MLLLRGRRGGRRAAPVRGRRRRGRRRPLLLQRPLVADLAVDAVQVRQVVVRHQLVPLAGLVVAKSARKGERNKI